MSKVLIVEDEVNILFSLKTYLEGQGNRVFITDCRGEAFSIVQDHTPDIILMDIHLGTDSGISISEEIRKRQLKIPIIMLSSSAYKDTIVSAMKAGADYFIAKPFKLPFIGQTIKKLVSNR